MLKVKTDKPCINCKYSGLMVCNHDKAIIYYSAIDNTTYRRSMSQMRKLYNNCGFEGKLYEPNKLERIKLWMKNLFA